jgi:tRNA(fMet)-specific endonuclease VapC
VKLLDTNVCVAVLSGGESAVVGRLRRESADLVLCSVVKAELLYGAHHSARVSENLARLSEFFSLFPSLPFDDDAAEHYAVLRAALRRAGTPIGPNDLLIAAIALGAGATVVTRNAREFDRVPGLPVEAW